MTARLLFLIGYMGCGKSSLGRKLARRLTWRLVDTDAEIERLEGASVSDIFRFEGEEAFRRMERAAIERAIAEESPAVVSTGGGLPVWSDNMERMNGAGMTVYIRRSAERIAERLSPYGRARRPKLRGLSDEELVDFMRHNMAEREPWYSRAQLILEADGFSDEELIGRILEAIEAKQKDE